MHQGYHYTTCGLWNIWLRNGYEMRESAYGESVAIKDTEGLHRANGLYLVRNKPSLSGAEVRFLRRELTLSQFDFATCMGVSEFSVRGWENNRTEITRPAESLLGVIYEEFARGETAVRALIEHIGRLNHDSPAKAIELEETEEGWRAEAA